MLGHQLRHQRPAFRVERRRRLVQKPERARFNQQPGKRQPALLPGRQAPSRHGRPAGQADPLHGGVGGRSLPPEIPGPESRLFGRRFRGLHRVEVTEKVEWRIFPCARVSHRPGMLPRQARENAKQGRFARSVCAPQFKRFACFQMETEVFEQDTKPPRRREVFDLKDQ